MLMNKISILDNKFIKNVKKSCFKKKKNEKKVGIYIIGGLL